MSDLALSVTRQINASPATVWRCITKPKLLTQWFAPRPVENTETEVDLTPGGIFNIVMKVPEHGEIRGPSGCVLLAESHKRFVWAAALGPTFVPNPPHTHRDDFYLTVNTRLEARDGGCLYATHALHATSQAVAAHKKMGFRGGRGTTTGQLAQLAENLG
ncbi:MAG: SRPBCC domain-containing protein [Octadecabacter sp.]